MGHCRLAINGEKAELDFYVKLNGGAKQSLHALNTLMACAFARDDACRLDRRGIAFETLMNSGSPEDMVARLLRVMLNHGGMNARRDRNNDEEMEPPSELYFFVRDRCDLFQEAAAVAHRNENRGAHHDGEEQGGTDE